jgi:hypothetical protein
MCINGMLLHAVRVIKQGYPDWEVMYFLDKRHHCGTREQLAEIVRLAHLAIMAADLYKDLPAGQRLPSGAIPGV